MIIAAVGDTGYNIVLVLHILSAFVAFSPAFVHPVLGEQSKAFDGTGRSTLLGFIVQNGRRIYAPALIVTGILGFALQGMSDGAWEFGQTWIWLAILIWIVMNGLLHAVVLPAEQAVADGDDAAESRLKAGGLAITALLVVMIYLMVDKPGF